MENKEPVLILDTKEGLIDYLNYPLTGMDKYRVKSIWMCNLIEKMFTETGNRFAYNADIKKRAEIELGLPRTDYGKEGDTLSSIVYNAQGYVRHDYMILMGFEPLTQELVNKAGEQKKKIQFESGKVANVRKVKDKWYAMQKYSRTRAFLANGEAFARIV